MAERDSIEAAVRTAAALSARTEIAPAAAAIVAVLDAMAGASWPDVPIETLVATATGVDQGEIRAQLAELVRCGVVARTARGHALDPDARRAIGSGALANGGAILGKGGGIGGEFGNALAAKGAAVVVSVGALEANEHRDVAREVVVRTAAGYVLLIPGVPPLEELRACLRDAWLRGALAVIDARESPLDLLSAAAGMPARLAVIVDAARAGEALARLGATRAPIAWPLRRPAPPISKAPVPRALQPLVAGNWNGLRVSRPAHRVAALRGSPAAIDSAARAVAAGTGVALARIDLAAPTAVARACEALPDARVALLANADAPALSPLAAYAIAALAATAPGVVLVGADAPAPLAALVEASIDVDNLHAGDAR